MTPRPWTLPLLAALVATPGLARANPTAVAALPTAAIASDPGIAEAVMPPTSTTTTSTTRVTVEVSPSSEVDATQSTPEPCPEPLYEPEPWEPSLAERYASQAHDDRKAGRGLLAGGLSLAGAAYLFTALGGAVAIDNARDFHDDPLTEANEARGGERRRSFGRALLIPGIGPALAIRRAHSAVWAWGAGVGGLAQAVGVGLALLGTHRLVRARRLERLSLGAGASPQGAQVTLGMRF